MYLLNYCGRGGCPCRHADFGALGKIYGSEALTAYQDELLAEDGKYAVVKHEAWINRVSEKFCDKIRKNLAYSAARS